MEAAKKDSEIEAHMSFDVIRYSQVWEDSRCLCAALEIGPQDTVLSISSSGCNALALLLKGPQKLVACDLSPAQNAVLALKIAAIPRLSHEEFMQLLGFLRSTQRQTFYKEIQGFIASPFDKFWQDNTSILETGLISEGRLDRFFREFAQEYFVKMPDAQKFKNCFYQEHNSVPSKFLASVKAPEFARKFSEAFSQTLAKKGRDPAQYRYVKEENIGDVFYERMVDFLSTNSFFGNHYMHYFFFGEPIKPTLGPDYVRPENYQKLSLLLDRIEVKTQTIEDEIQKPTAKPFTKANLSNIFEYMSAENMTALLQTMGDHMPSGSRIAYWNLLVDRPLPDALGDRFHALTLNIPKDQLWFYKAFHVLERL